MNADKQTQVTSKLQIHIPDNLHTDGGYEHREALFGIPPYGGSIQQQLYYADSTLCDPSVNVRAGYPERAADEDGRMTPWKSPFLLMVDRGGCTFVTKVRHAQRAGASGVIIADNSCLCKFQDKCKPEPDTQCEDQEPIMADDGSGNDISIPSFLMFKQDADPIKSALKQNTFVRMEMAWALPSEDTVEYSLWSVPADPVAQPFEEQFGDAAILLGDKAKFTPHFNVYSGIDAGCDKDGVNQCLNLCTNAGRYCAIDPDADVSKGASGADVVKESLRRMCIWEIYGKDGVGKQWWKYVSNFVGQCANAADGDFFHNEGCINDAMNKAEVDSGKVNKCMDESGGVENDVPNQLIDKELSSKIESGVVIWPAAFVNGVPIRGALEFDVVLKAVCAGYSSGAKPNVCRECSSCPSGEYACVKAGGNCAGRSGNTLRSRGVRSDVFVLSLLVLAFFFGCIFFVQYRRSQRHVREQVRGILAEYMPLDEDKITDTAISNGDSELT